MNQLGSSATLVNPLARLLEMKNEASAESRRYSGVVWWQVPLQQAIARCFVSIFVIIDAYLLEFPSQNVLTPSSNMLERERDLSTHHDNACRTR